MNTTVLDSNQLDDGPMLIREYVGQTFGQNWHYKYFDVERIPFLWHTHPEYELTLTLNARGTRYLGTDISEFGERDLALVGSNQPHTWHATSASKAPLHHSQVIFFTRDWLANLVEAGLPELSPFLAWLDKVGQGVIFSEACVERLLPCFLRLSKSKGLARLTILFEIFEELVSDKTSRRLAPATSLPLGDARLEAALAYLKKHYQRAISLAEVAQAVHTSSATLKRLFQQNMGLSLGTLLRQLRLNQAYKALISSSKSIQVIAEESGFTNYSNFCRHFKAVFWCTPADFRRSYHSRRGISHDLQNSSFWLNPDNFLRPGPTLHENKAYCDQPE